MRRSASEIISNLEMRIARLEKSALQVRHKTRQMTQLTPSVINQIARELGCSTRNCQTSVLNEGFDTELDTRYFLVKAMDKTSRDEMFFIVADQFGSQGIEDWGTDGRSLKRTFNLLLS